MIYFIPIYLVFYKTINEFNTTNVTLNFVMYYVLSL